MDRSNNVFRWQDWVNVALGIWLVVSPWETDYSLNTTTKENALGLGAVLIVFNLISVLRVKEEGQEILNIVLGAWLVLSPFFAWLCNVQESHEQCNCRGGRDSHPCLLADPR
jgi:hypothetical protein